MPRRCWNLLSARTEILLTLASTPVDLEKERKRTIHDPVRSGQNLSSIRSENEKIDERLSEITTTNKDVPSISLEEPSNDCSQDSLDKTTNVDFARDMLNELLDFAR